MGVSKGGRRILSQALCGAYGAVTKGRTEIFISLARKIGR